MKIKKYCRNCKHYDNRLCKVLWDGDDDKIIWLIEDAIILDYVYCNGFEYIKQEYINENAKIKV